MLWTRTAVTGSAWRPVRPAAALVAGGVSLVALCWLAVPALGSVSAPTEAGKVSSAGKWKASEAPKPRGSAKGRLFSITCRSATSCVAVGGTNAAGWLLTRTGSAWKAARAPVPAGSQAVDVDSVTCPSKATCVAAGGYTSKSGDVLGLLLTRNGSKWTGATAPVPSDAAANPQAELASVACSSASTCVVAGYYTNTSGNQEGMLLTKSGAGWTATAAPLPVSETGDPYAYLLSVACPSAAGCVAVGAFDDSTAGYQQTGLLEVSQGSTWTALRTPVPSNPTGDSSLVSVACPSPASCVAAGSYNDNQLPLFVTGHGLTWQAATAKLPAHKGPYPSALLQTVTCPSVSSCISVGSYDDSAKGYLGLIISGHGSSWRSVKAPLPAGAAAKQGSPGTQLTAVSCPSPTTCVAVGEYTSTKHDGELLLLTGHGSSWKAAKAPLPANAETVNADTVGVIGPPFLQAISCPSKSACFSVGGYTARKHGLQGLVLSGPG